MTTSVNGVAAITLRANLKAMRIRPARESGDKPVFEILIRTEVNESTFAIARAAGRDMTVHLVPDPEIQPHLPEPAEEDAGLSLDGEVDDELVDQVSIPSNGRRRRGTRSSEQVPV